MVLARWFTIKWNQKNNVCYKSKEKGDGLYELPVELNIEGFWYNKKIFADNGIAVPTTWDEVLKIAEDNLEQTLANFPLQVQFEFVA